MAEGVGVQLLVAEVAVEAERPLVAAAHPEVHAGRAVGAEEVLERRHQTPAPARALGLREQVDVEVRRVLADDASSGGCGWCSIAMRSSSRSLPPLPIGWRSRSGGHHSASHRASKARVSMAPSA